MSSNLTKMVRGIAVLLVKIYQSTISRLTLMMFGRVCVFDLSCSDYSVSVIERFGVLKGFVLTAKRLAKCHMFAKDRHDPVPGKFDLG